MVLRYLMYVLHTQKNENYFPTSGKKQNYVESITTKLLVTIIWIMREWMLYSDAISLSCHTITVTEQTLVYLF